MWARAGAPENSKQRTENSWGLQEADVGGDWHVVGAAECDVLCCMHRIALSLPQDKLMPSPRRRRWRARRA